jgi:hypothetical protein
MNLFKNLLVTLVAGTSLAVPAGAVTVLTTTVNTTTAQSTTAVLNQFAGPGTTTFPGTTSSASAPAATVGSFNTNLGVLTGARVSVSIPYTLTVTALAPTVPASGSGRTVDVSSTLSAAITLAGTSIVGTSFTATPKCNSGDCLNGSSNNIQTFSGTFSGTQTVSTANLAQLASSGVGTVSFGSAILGANTTVINGTGIPALNPDGTGGGGARSSLTLGSTTTAQNQYSVAYDYVKFSMPSFTTLSQVTANSINLGTRFVDSGATSASFTIANIGDINTAATSLIGTARSVDDTRFSTSFASLNNLAAGSSQNFNVSFNSTTAGSFSDIFTFTMQDAVAGGVGLRSTPLALTVNATVLNRSAPSFNAATVQTSNIVNLGSRFIDDVTPMTANYLIANIGGANTAGTQLVGTAQTNNDSRFTTSFTSLSNLAAGASTLNQTVSFNPTMAGTFTETFTFTMRDVAPGATDLRATPLALTAQAQVLNRATPSFDPIAALLNQSLDFGNVDLRGGPVTLSFALYNQGDNNSAGLQLLSTTNSNSLFNTNLNTFINLSGGGSQIFTVTFAPTSTGVVNSLISLLVSDYAPGVTGTARQTTLSINAIANVFDPVPEPQSWAMMIAGFGLTGAALRRQRRAARAV